MEERFFEANYPKESRFSEIEKLLSFVKKGDSCQVISVPGAGRTTMLGLLAFNKAVREEHLKEEAENYHFVMVNFLELRDKPISETMKFLFVQIVNSLEDRPLDDAFEKATKLLHDSLSFNDPLLVFEGLKKAVDLACFEKNKHLVLLFSQFETYIPMLTPEFFAYMKTLQSRARYKLSLVFSLHKPMEYILEPQLFQDIEASVEDNTIFLPLLDKPSLTFHIKYIEKAHQKNLPDALKEEILALTAGHQRLTRIAVEKLLDADQIPTERTSFLLEQKPILATLKKIWHTLSPAEQTHFTKHLIPSVLNDEHSQYLRHVGLMTEKTIAIPLFEAFVKTLQQAPEKKQFIYNKETNTIFLSDQDISDTLTATEFRLLAFFLDHKDIVADRDRIIASVWKDTATTLGVTDQALDQLIFRLRRKIEDDPNSPTHLLTIKGRGLKFVS